MDDLSEGERIVVENLRGIKANKGHGTLRVEVRAGTEALVKREHSTEIKKALDK